MKDFLGVGDIITWVIIHSKPVVTLLTVFQQLIYFRGNFEGGHIWTGDQNYTWRYNLSLDLNRVKYYLCCDSKIWRLKDFSFIYNLYCIQKAMQYADFFWISPNLNTQQKEALNSTLEMSNLCQEV